MPKANAPLIAFNRGEVSRLVLARTDVDRLRLSAETQVNWVPSTLGPMSLRPGLAFVGGIRNDGAARVLPFVFASSDTALIELTANAMRVWVDDALVTRPNAGFTSPDLSGGTWTYETFNGGAATIIAGTLVLNGVARGGLARAKNAIATSTPGIEHALRIVVTRGPITFRVGSGDGLDDLVPTTALGTGVHSIAFTPAGTFYPQFETAEARDRIVASVAREAPGALDLPTPWGASHLPDVRVDQSADVVFVACRGVQQRRIERRSKRSWSVVRYEAGDGPFRAAGDSSIYLTPSDISGQVTLSASRAYFKPGHVGALFQLTHSGQTVSANLGAAATSTDTIRVAGVSLVSQGGTNVATTDRNFTLALAGTWTGTITLERSFEGPDTGFVDYKTYTGNTTETIADGLNNLVAWYRLSFKATGYGSGVAGAALSYPGGSGSGVCRVVSYTDAQNVVAEVLTPFAGKLATTSWREGEWSDLRGWPTSVSLHEGRLWWAGADKFGGSISDTYDSFDIEVQGDAGPIIRSIARGPIAVVSWLVGAQRLIAGTDTAEVSARSSSFDKPLTPTNFTLKDCSTQGSARLPALRVDSRVLFVQQSGRKLYELTFDVQSGDYVPRNLNRMNPDIGLPSLAGIAVQRQPDTRVHLPRSDGQVAVLLYEPREEIEAFFRVQTDGVVEDVAVLPGPVEDRVYYVVRRTIGGVTRRYLERFARQDECVGGALTRLADSHVVYQGAATSTVTGLAHLEGKQVVVWADGADAGTRTVTGGQIALTAPAANVCVGLAYSATYVSTKLAYAAQLGTALTQVKKIDHVGLILADTHHQGLLLGQRLDALDPLPLVEEEAVTPAGTIYGTYDERAIPVPGEWDTDARLCLVAQAPRPVTVCGAVVSLITNG